MIKVLLADDQLLFRLMLEEMLRKDNEIEIVATASDGYEAVELVRKCAPDVALLDIQMPKLSGVEALREIKQEFPAVKVIMLTTFENLNNLNRASKYKADGYILKDIKPETLIMAIKCTCNNLVVVHKDVYTLFSERERVDVPRDRIEIDGISFDRIDVLIIKNIAEGKTNKAIAKMLNYSEGTVKNRITKILDLTGLADRTEITVFAIKNSII